jgi:UrcA family protein
MKTSNKIRAGAAIFSLCGLAALSTLHSASAAEDTLPMKKVSFGDLDISKAAGAQALYRRIVAAAHQVCEVNQFKTLTTSHLIEGCIDRAIDNAVRDVDSPALTALRPASAIKVAKN